MSHGLYWRPPPDERDRKQLDRQLKYPLGRRLWDHDGSLKSPALLIGAELVPYLQGLRDAAPAPSEMADLRGACDELLAAIERFGSVELCIE